MPMFRWTRLSTQNMEEIWHLRLAELDPESIVMLTRPESRSLTLQVFSDKKTVTGLARKFGGKTARLSDLLPANTPHRPRAPLSIRGRLRIHSDEASWKTDPRPDSAILIPAGMAFGTGDHATTATCLRILCDLSPTLPPGWRALDAGTGSGILAIAAEKLGASSVEAFDFDPVCLRVTKENAQQNRCRKITLAQADSRHPEQFQKADIILANLFSELLIASAPGLLKKLRPAGHLIFSGVLKQQAAEVCAALEQCGLTTPRLSLRGKWCAGITSRKKP